MGGIRTQVLAGAAVLALTVGVGQAAAQDDMAMMSHPGHIHSGSCDQLGDVVFPLTNASMGMEGMMGGMMASPEGETMASPEMGMGEMMGSEAAVMVATSVTTVDAPLEDILADQHAINFHESEENIQNYIACGDIGGMIATGPGMEQGGTLVIGLRELNDSGYSGIAVLEGMDDQTEVSVYLAHDLSGAGMAMDETEGDATPTS